MLSKKINYLFLVTLMVLQGCGFHLRGQPSNSIPETNIKLNLAQKNSSLELSVTDQNISSFLKNQLIYEIKKTNFSNSKLKQIELQIFDEKYAEEIQVLDAQGQLREIKLIKQVNFLLKDLTQNTIIYPLQNIQVMSDFSVNEALILSKSTEKQRIIEGMQKQLAHDVLQRSFYFLQNF